MSKHFQLAASAMERWEACPGSIKLSVGCPNIESDAAREGTIAHGYAERFLLSTLPAEEFARLPEDMQDAIKVYGRAIHQDMMRSPNTVLLVEQHFDMSKEVHPETGGTADGVVWNPDSRVLHVFDFKYGKGHFVEVEKNVQMLTYGLGALVLLKYPARFVELVVVQPRCTKKVGAVRRWRVPALEILDFEERLVTAAKRTEEASPALNPGRHCFWCPAHTKCPAKTAERLSKAADSFEEIPAEEDDEDFDPFS